MCFSTVLYSSRLHFEHDAMGKKAIRQNQSYNWKSADKKNNENRRKRSQENLLITKSFARGT